MRTRTMRLWYGAAALLIFLIEGLIARTTGFFRFTVGDFLVVMLIYAAFRVIFPLKPSPEWLAAGVFGFSICVELSQYFHLIERLGLEGERAAHLTMGSTFDWGDLAAYGTGCLAAWGLDRLFRNWAC